MISLTVNDFVSSLKCFLDIFFSIRKNVFLQNHFFNLSIPYFSFHCLRSVVFFSIPFFKPFLFEEAFSFLNVLTKLSQWHSRQIKATGAHTKSTNITPRSSSVENRCEEFSFRGHVHPSVFKEILENIKCSSRNNLTKN